MSDIEKVGVVGCGLMGSGIAEVSAASGFDVVVREIDGDALQKGLSSIEKSLEKAVQREKRTAEERDAALDRIEGTVELEPLADCDLIIEAIVEDVDAKTDLWSRLDELCPEGTIFASNTSSIPIAEMASATDRADRFLGLHFFNPVPVMGLVEIVRGGATSDETMEAAYGFGRALGKEPIEAKDTCGFIVNRLLIPYMLDAIRAYENGVGSIPDIDRGMELGCGHPMGPFTLGDFVGLDTTLHIADIMYDEYKDPRYAAPQLLRRMVQAGLHGRKTGAGFYDYSGEEPVVSEFVER
jgi:3-hydroxybutyryl-CoA dehydrogenase